LFIALPEFVTAPLWAGLTPGFVGRQASVTARCHLAPLS
jgi:hypothetical protein